MRSLLRSFAGGEVTPELFARADDIRFQTGLALSQNCMSLPHGPARNRPGSGHVGVARYGASGVVLALPFTFSVSQTYIIEFGAQGVGTGYFRFIQNGVYVKVIDSGTPAAYVPSAQFTNAGINAGTEEVTFGGAHGFTSGQPARLTNNIGGLPPPFLPLITTDTVIYVRAVSPTVVAFYATAAQAIAGGAPGLLNMTAPPGGTWNLNYAYQRGDLVSSGGVFYYCRLDPTQPAGGAQIAPGNPTYWYAEPASGEYEIPHPYIDTNLAFVRFFQSNDVLSLRHDDHPMRTLRRYGQVNWQLVDEAISPVLAAPTGVIGTATEAGMSLVMTAYITQNPLRLQAASVVPWVNGESIVGLVSGNTGGVGPNAHLRAVSISGRDFDPVLQDGTRIDASTWGAFLTGQFKAVPFSSDLDNKYRITAMGADNLQSVPSAEVTVTNNLYAEGAYNTLTWNAVAGAAKYRIYRQLAGLYGLIATVDAGILTLKDDHLEVQLDQGLPIIDLSPGIAPYPTAGCYHEQRKVAARDQLVWMTRPGTETDFTFTIPVRDDDRLAFSFAATEFSRIMHTVSMGDLLLLTTSAEYAVTSPDSVVLTPTSIMPRAHSFVGSSHVKPWVVNNSLVFFASRGGHVRELEYRATAQGYEAGDLSLRAAHLFDNLTIVGSAVSKAPYPVIWCVSSNGKLLGLTYVPDQQVAGWHQHTFGTGATVESCAVVAEGNEDRLYLVVRRVINGSATRHFERLAPMAVTAVADAFFVDDGKTFTNVAAGLLGGFSHLIGQTVSILADGIVLPQQVVNSAGQILLLTSYAKVTAGVPIAARLQTLPLVMQLDGFAQGQPKNVSRVWVRVANSAPFRLGPRLDELVPSDSTAPSMRGLLTAEVLQTKRELVRAAGAWTDDGQVFIEHTTPLPLTVVGLTLEVAVGD